MDRIRVINKKLFFKNFSKSVNNLLNLSRETSNKNMGTTIINNSNVVAGGPGGKGNEEGEEVFFGSSVANDFSSFIPMFIEATV